MERKFILSCGSTVDLPYFCCESRDIPVIFYTYEIDGVEYLDDMGQDPTALPAFYDKINAGKLPHTSQINVERYIEFFDGLLKQGDVLHLAFGSGLSGSVRNAQAAAQEIAPRYPDRVIRVIDTLAASSGQGMLVEYAADMRDEGKSLDEVCSWVEENKLRLNHQFFCTDLSHFRRSGRVSGSAAMLGALLGICPIMHLNNEGKIIAYGKVRGKQNAIRETLRVMQERADNGAQYDGKCFICNSHCIDIAERLREGILNIFPNVKEVRICDIGTIIGSHTGIGTVAVFFLGKSRAEFVGDT